MNYSFKYVSVDNYILKYTDKEGKDKELPFTRTVEIATKLQGIVAKARLKMFKELSAQGVTKNDLIIKVINKDGTISYDETNYREYEKYYMELEGTLTLDEVVKDCFNMSISELLVDMGVDPNTTDEEVTSKVLAFSQKFSAIIGGKDNPPSDSTSNKE